MQQNEFFVQLVGWSLNIWKVLQWFCQITQLLLPVNLNRNVSQNFTSLCRVILFGLKILLSLYQLYQLYLLYLLQFVYYTILLVLQQLYFVFVCIFIVIMEMKLDSEVSRIDHIHYYTHNKHTFIQQKDKDLRREPQFSNCANKSISFIRHYSQERCIKISKKSIRSSQNRESIGTHETTK